MAEARYEELALNWQPSQKEDRFFLGLLFATLGVSVIVACLVASVEVPQTPISTKANVPERVVRFIDQREVKPKPPVITPPKPVEPPKVEVPVKKDPVTTITPVREPKITQPLTKEQEAARSEVANKGILGLREQLGGLTEVASTSAAQVRNRINTTSDTPTTSAGHDIAKLTANAVKGSGGVSAEQYSTNAGTTELAVVETNKVAQVVEERAQVFHEESPSRTSSGTGKPADESVTLIFDRNKAQLQSLYNRARRSNPSIKGKVILELTIEANGSVKAVDVISSELSDNNLLKDIVARVRQYQFPANPSGVWKTKYPLEFLPQ